MLVVPMEKPLPVRAARSGDPEAWDALFQRYQRPLYAYVFEWVHDEQTSLDIVQESFIKAVRHLGTLREDGKFGSWLFGIAHQKCVQHWRRGHPTEPFEEEHEGGTAPAEGPAEQLIRQEDQAAFLAGLEQLPSAQRSVLVLHFLEEFSLEEIARITAVPLGTVKSRIHFAKKALRQWMEERTP